MISEANDYNRNLVSMPREAEPRARIEIGAVDTEVVGAGTFLKATTLVHWRAMRA